MQFSFKRRDKNEKNIEHAYYSYIFKKEKIVRPKNYVESRGEFNVATAAECFLSI